MMKYIFLPLLTFIFLHSGFAQKVDFNQVIPPSDKKPLNFEELLVQIAWMNAPLNQVLNSEKSIAEQNIKISKLEWTRAIGFNFGFNRNRDFTDPITGQTDPSIFPRLTVGAFLNINPLLTTGAKVKVAKENVKIADSEINQEKLKIRKEISQNYQRYLSALEIHKVRQQMVEDATANYQLMKQLFQKNEVTFENYNTAFSAYHLANENQLKAQIEIRLAKIEIEALIGIPFTEAEKIGRELGIH